MRHASQTSGHIPEADVDTLRFEEKVELVAACFNSLYQVPMQ